MEVTRETLRFLSEAIPGNNAIYLVNRGKLKKVFESEHLPSLNGMTKKEYDEITGEDALGIILPEDRERVRAALIRCLSAGNILNVNYRVIHRTRGFDWVNANGHVCGTMDGKAVLVVTYTNASVESEMYQQLLDRTKSRVYVSDRNTFELLYVNSPAAEFARRYRGEKAAEIVGKTCYQYAKGLDRPCKDCILNRIGAGEVYRNVRYSEERDTWEQISGEYIRWCGRDAYVQCVDDITDSEKKKLEIQRILETEERMLHQNQIINGAGPVNERLNAFLKDLGEYLNADRTYIFRLRGGRLFNTYEWCRKGVTPQINVLQDIDIGLMERWMQDFDNKRCITVKDVEEIREGKPDEYDIMKMQDISSYIEAPLFENGVLSGFIGADNPEQEKLMHSNDMLMSLAYSVSNVITKAEDEEEKELRYNRMYRQIAKVNPYSLGTFRLNLTKNICSDGQSPFESVMKQQESGTADGYLASNAAIIADEAHRRAYLRMFTREKLIEAFNNGLTERTVEYPVRTAKGDIIWIDGFVNMVQNPSTDDIEAVTYALNVTERKTEQNIVSCITEEKYDHIGLINISKRTFELRKKRVNHFFRGIATT